MQKFFVCVFLFSNVLFAAIAPQFQGELLGGGRTSLKQRLKPDRALLICFWASWCTPCMQELKTVTDRLKAEPNLPLDVLSVNVDTSETSSDVRPSLKLYKFEVPVIMDPTHEIFSKYQESKTLPFSALIKPNGEIARTFSGYNEEMFNEVKEIVGAPKEANAKP